MQETNASIGQVKRDISELVNRVAYGDERIVLTSRGKPKGVLIGMEDYQHLVEAESMERLARWQAWLEQANQLGAAILERRQGNMWMLIQFGKLRAST
jgi:prevent-host-death family protein